MVPRNEEGVKTGRSLAMRGRFRGEKVEGDGVEVEVVVEGERS